MTKPLETGSRGNSGMLKPPALCTAPEHPSRAPAASDPITSFRSNSELLEWSAVEDGRVSMAIGFNSVAWPTEADKFVFCGLASQIAMVAPLAGST